MELFNHLKVHRRQLSFWRGAACVADSPLEGTHEGTLAASFSIPPRVTCQRYYPPTIEGWTAAEKLVVTVITRDLKISKEWIHSPQIDFMFAVHRISSFTVKSCLKLLDYLYYWENMWLPHMSAFFGMKKGISEKLTVLLPKRSWFMLLYFCESLCYIRLNDLNQYVSLIQPSTVRTSDMCTFQTLCCFNVLAVPWTATTANHASTNCVFIIFWQSFWGRLSVYCKIISNENIFLTLY